MMIYVPKMHHRRSIRLKGFDYRRAARYFITICTQGNKCLFGEIMNGEMHLTDAGRMVENGYRKLEDKFLDIVCDEYVCMPNHLHFIITNIGADRFETNPVRTDSVGASPCARPNQKDDIGVQNQGEHIGSPLQNVIHWFKTMTTNEYIRSVKQNGWASFSGKLWQQNYYEHIIRNKEALCQIRKYILNNQSQWEWDRENPAQVESEPPSLTDEPWRI